MLDLGRTFLQSVERSPGAVAVVDGPLRLTYAQWHERIKAVAGGLRELGLDHGDHLLAVLQNRWEMATLHWACQFLGVIVTPLNWRAKPRKSTIASPTRARRCWCSNRSAPKRLSRRKLRVPRCASVCSMRKGQRSPSNPCSRGQHLPRGRWRPPMTSP
jgi:acyl-CoA synthetase (AMP-forming)/AMP-acid ligase II